MTKNTSLLLENIEKELLSLSQEELYDLLISCGIEGLEKLDGEEGKIILTDENKTLCTCISYETTEKNLWNHVIYENKELTNNSKSYNLAA